MLLDRVRLGWSNHRALNGHQTYLSVSRLKLFEEDPWRFYLRYVRRMEEPPTLPLVFGGAMHAALEAYYAGEDPFARLEEELRANIDRVEDLSWRYALDDPSSASGKERVETTPDEVLDFGRRVLRFALGYLPRIEGARVEVPLGELTDEYIEQELYDHRRRQTRRMRVALVAGLPFHGYVDLITDEFIVDHKFVTHAVSYYGDRRFPPSYDAAEDMQLDVYAAASGCRRAGFNLITLRPQPVGPDGLVWPTWIPASRWKGEGCPMVMVRSHDHSLIFVWRERDPEESLRRLRSKLARLVSELTASFLLLEDRVVPEVAFPPGDPVLLHRARCPFCPLLCKFRFQTADDPRSQRLRLERRRALRERPYIMEEVEYVRKAIAGDPACT